MSSFGNNSRYDAFVEVFGFKADEWPQMKPFLNLLEENYQANGTVELPTKAAPYDLALTRNYVDSTGANPVSSGGNQLSKQFTCFVAELITFIAGVDINKGTAAKWGTGPQSTLSEDVTFTAAVNAVTSSKFFAALFDAIATPAASQLSVATKFTFKTAPVIIKNLGIAALLGSNAEAIPKDGTTGASIASGYDNKETDPTTVSAALSTVAGECKKFRGTSTKFMFKIDKHILKQVFGTALATAKGKSKFWTEMPTTTSAKPEDMYFREVGKPGKLFMKGADGKPMEIQPGSEYFKNLKQGTNCFDIGFVTDATAKKTCEQFFLDCLNGDDIGKCKEFMTTNNYWANASTDVTNMDPNIAAKILYKFGFQHAPVENEELGLTLNLFPAPEVWLSSLSTNFPSIKDAEVESITKNEKLIGFLRLLVKKINQNPAVINENYTKGALTTDPEAFKSTSFGKMGIPSKFVVVGKSGVSSESISRLRDTIMQYRLGYANNLYIPFPMSLFGYSMQLRGGADEQEGGSYVKTLEAIMKSNELPQTSSQQLTEIYEALIGTLQAGKRDLDVADKETMTKMKEELKTVEEKLFTANVYLAKFVELVGVHGLDKGGNGVLTLDNIIKFVEKHNQYFEKTVKKENDFLSAIYALANAVDTETKDKKESKSVITYPQANFR